VHLKGIIWPLKAEVQAAQYIPGLVYAKVVGFYGVAKTNIVPVLSDEPALVALG